MRRSIYSCGVALSLLVFCCTAALGGDAAKAAPPEQAAFQVKNVLTVKIPKDAQTVRVWFAVPQEDAYSTITNFSVATDYPVHYDWDSWGNKVGYLEVRGASQPEFTITETFDLKRTEMRNAIDAKATRPLTDTERNALSRYLQPTTYVVVNDQIKALAAQITGGETNPVLAARKLYDWTLQNVDYWVKDPDHLKASPVGSSDYCLRTKTGNCTDFHSLFASLAIASGIPTRMIYGSLLKPTLDGIQVDASYHCWIQFYAPNLGWLPLDVSLANIYGKEFPLTDKNKKLVELTTATGYHGLDPSKVDYYFGNIDDRRVVWSVGRDLMMQPPQNDGPVNSLPKVYVEVNGKQSTDWTREFTYKQITP
ncbi:MAG TPA: transglutaminase domain-containing protein [Candidatus Acidoferrales bacterium]|nr:transglutaminase domain-containing protein [Candidatus Acidoferrales bacterium]